MQRKYDGVYAIVLVPFKNDGSVDFDSLEAYVDKLSKLDCFKGFVVCGSTGEFTRLSFEENVQVMKSVKAANNGRKQFICGATAGDSYTSKKYINEISRLDADGVLVAPPYYFKLKDCEILEFYKEIALNNCGLDIIGYNIPQCTNAVSVNVFEKLLGFDCIKGFKNSWNDMQEITSEIALRDKLRPDVSYFTGLDACLYGTTALGGNGIFSAITYLMPEINGFIYKNFGTKEALNCQFGLIKLIDTVNNFSFPFSYRVLSEAVGNPLGVCRQAVPISEKNTADILIPKMKQIYSELKEKYIK